MNGICEYCGKTDSTVKPRITVDSINASAGEKIEVKVKIDNNPGIFGAILSFKFDSGLVLVDAVKGDAFEVLEMTGPGKYVSPCNFVWDGMTDPAEKDGVIVTLFFEVSETVKVGDLLKIECSCLTGDIVDADFRAIDILISNGAVTVN